MIRQLTVDEILDLVRSAPEQAVFDWKFDFSLPKDDDSRGELVKDIAAIANAAASSYGFIIYGVDPRKPDIVVGVSNQYDDAKLQELLKGKIEPPVDFVYYEVSLGTKVVSVIQIKPGRRRPHIIRVDLGRVRKGQIPIRRGSSTDGVTINDLLEFFYGQSSGYFPQVVKRLQLDVAQQNATNEYLRILQDQANQALRDMEISIGAPQGSLGAKW
jgi:predicted HTH transcriptional regulator